MITLPFPVRIFDKYSATLCLGMFGYLKLDHCYANADDLYPFGSDLRIHPGHAHGIDYRVSGPPGSRTIRFRYYVSHYGNPLWFFNYTVTLNEGYSGSNAGRVLVHYYSMWGNGHLGEVKAFAADDTERVPYSPRDAKLTPNKFVEFDTVGRTFIDGTST